MKKSNVWACDYGCDLGRRPCEHLEKLLPQMRDGRLPIMDGKSRATTFDPLVGPAYTQRRKQEEEFREVLQKFGIIQQWDVQLLVDRYVNDRSIREIRFEHNFTDLKTAFYRLRELRRILVERGMKPRRRS